MIGIFALIGCENCLASDTRLRLAAAIGLVFCGSTARLVIARLTTIVVIIAAAIISVAVVVAAVCTNAILTLPLTLGGRRRLRARIIRI
jgi:hypothetical protein